MKAMPIMLTTPAGFDAWLAAEPAKALKVQRPLPCGRLSVAAKCER